MIKSSDMTWAWHEAHMEKLQTKFYQKDLKEKDRSEEIVSDIWIILKCILEKWDCRLIWLSTRNTDGLSLTD
jgi:hypothetical protein